MGGRFSGYSKEITIEYLVTLFQRLHRLDKEMKDEIYWWKIDNITTLLRANKASEILVIYKLILAGGDCDFKGKEIQYFDLYKIYKDTKERKTEYDRLISKVI